MTTGDLDGDGNTDVVLATGTDFREVPDTISIMWGDGTGDFETTDVDVELNADARGLTIIEMGDFNGDDAKDLAVIDRFEDVVLILLSTGDRTFGPEINSPSLSQPSDLAAADFNGDNKLDLVVTNHDSFSSAVSILLGDGTGHFAAPTKFSVGVDPIAVATGDFNGDGNVDVVTVNQLSDTGSVLLGNGTGSFAPATSVPVGGEQPSDVVVTDFNGDDKQDLAILNRGVPDGVSILFGNGTGSFVPDTHYRGSDTGNPPHFSMAAGDFNNDGKPDLVFDTRFQNLVSVLLNDGNGRFGNLLKFTVGTEPAFVGVGDFNNDGKHDVATCDNDEFYSSGVTILPGNGAGGFLQAPRLGTAGAVEAGDFNGDGKTDLVGSNNSIWLSDGMGGFTEKINAGDVSGFLLVGDLNADGKQDLVKLYTAREQFGVRLGDGAGGLGTETKFTLADDPSCATLADFNGDHKLDIVVGTDKDSAPINPGGDVYILIGDGAGGFAAPVNIAPDLEPESVASADFNGDGKPDLAVARATTNPKIGEIAIFRGNGLGGFQAPTTFNLKDGFAVDLRIADLNHDNHLDIAAIKDFDSNVPIDSLKPKHITIMMGDGAGSFSLPVDFVLPQFMNWGFHGQLNVGDFNGDSHTDLTVINHNGNEVALLMGDGEGRFGAPVYFVPGSGPQSSAVGDFNGDGKLDLATGTVSAGGIAILYGLCFAAATPTPTPTPSPTPTPTPSPSPTPTPPVLLTEGISSRAIALDSVTFKADPFSVRTTHNFSADQHTRIMLFATNLDLLPGETLSAVTAQAETQGGQVHPLTVEFVGPVFNINSLTQINVRLPDGLAAAGNVQVSVSLRGVASNKVLITIVASPP